MLNVQADVRRRLSEMLAPVPVKVSVPENMPDEFVTVRRDGGAWENGLLDKAGLEIYAWAKSEADACALAEKTADAMASLCFADGYASVRMEQMCSDADPNTRKPRWYLSDTIKNFKPTEQRRDNG